MKCIVQIVTFCVSQISAKARFAARMPMQYRDKREGISVQTAENNSQINTLLFMLCLKVDKTRTKHVLAVEILPFMRKQ